MNQKNIAIKGGWCIQLCTAIFLFLTPLVQAQVSLPHVFSDHMILQRNCDIPVWGTAPAGTPITVRIGAYTINSIADEHGNWILRIPQMQAGGPYELAVFNNGQEPSVVFEDVLIGDVWFASGQSNMEWQVQQSKDASTEIQTADFANIRFFKVPHDTTTEIQYDTQPASWKRCDSTSVKDVSAVGYFFARDLHRDLNVPIGILQCTWGGTPVESWMSREQLLSSSVSRARVQASDSITVQHFVKDSLDLIRFWDIVYNPKNDMEKEIPKMTMDDSGWSELTMPSTFSDWNMPPYEGMVWLRKYTNIPDSMSGKELTINLGHPEMNYSLYFNGKEICKTVWNANPSHQYTLSADLVKEGNNLIALRMAVLWGGGGLNPPAENMYITDGASRISLAGTWKYKKDLEPKIPKIWYYHRFPTFLYNGMVHPVIPYGIKGFIWYQGEDNADQPKDYQTLFPMLIADWRIRWQQGYLPFFYVQLANYMKRKPEPSESNWAALREAQTMTLSQPNTGMATIIDIGEAENIHPKNKQEVGRRLALLAKDKVYRENIQSSGPVYRKHKVDGNRIVIEFSETGSGLTVNGGGVLKGFAVAGKDRVFYWAEATIDGDKVIVSSQKINTPVAVRYAWADNPECNLFNEEGLPAVPFRTDDWIKN